MGNEVVMWKVSVHYRVDGRACVMSKIVEDKGLKLGEILEECARLNKEGVELMGVQLIPWLRGEENAEGVLA